MLLEAKAAVNLADSDGRTPLHHAVDDGDVPTVTVLLQAKGDVAIPNRWG